MVSADTAVVSISLCLIKLLLLVRVRQGADMPHGAFIRIVSEILVNLWL